MDLGICRGVLEPMSKVTEGQCIFEIPKALYNRTELIYLQ